MIWFSFVGTWLLVTGSVFQAVLELREQDNLRDEVSAVLERAPSPPNVSPWWWLLPPVGYLLERRRFKSRQATMMAALSDAKQLELIQYMNKTTGWTIVGSGGFLIATYETWLVSRPYGQPNAVFTGLEIAGAVACLSFSPLWLRRLRPTDAAGEP